MPTTARLLVLAWMCLLLGVITAARAEPTTKPAAGDSVTTLRLTWHDSARGGRAVPVTIRFSETAAKPSPLIVFSHGLGGSRDHYEYLALHWAREGYIVVNPQHAGSDDAVWRKNPRAMQDLVKATRDPENLTNRPRDISFVIDQMLALSNDSQSPLHGRVDAQKIGVAGHSFGAYTTLVIGGQLTELPRQASRQPWMDKRVRALIPMSAPANARQASVKMFDPIALPTLHMTGTRDDSPIGGSVAAERRIPFDQMHRADNYLLILQEGDHAVFSAARTRGRDASRDAIHQQLILKASTAFWNAYLRDDAAARQWLQEKEGFLKELGKQGTFEFKAGGQPPARE